MGMSHSHGVAHIQMPSQMYMCTQLITHMHGKGTRTHIGLYTYVKAHAHAVTPMHNTHTPAIHMHNSHSHTQSPIHACKHTRIHTHTHKQTCCLALTIQCRKNPQAHRVFINIISRPQVIILVTMVPGGHSLRASFSPPPPLFLSLCLKKTFATFATSFTGCGDFPGGPVVQDSMLPVQAAQIRSSLRGTKIPQRPWYSQKYFFLKFYRLWI